MDQGTTRVDSGADNVLEVGQRPRSALALDRINSGGPPSAAQSDFFAYRSVARAWQQQ